MFIGLGLGFLQLLVGLILAMFSIYIGIRLFGEIVRGIEVEKELKQGNCAVAILMIAVVLSIANVVQSGVGGLTMALVRLPVGAPLESYIYPIVAGIVQVVVSIVLAVVAIYLAVRIFDSITKGIDEMTEVKKGNVAVAILMAGVLIAVSFVVQAGVSGMARSIGLTL